MDLYCLQGCTMVAACRRTERLFFWNGDSSIFLIQRGVHVASRPLKKSSLMHAKDAAEGWRIWLDLTEQTVLALGKILSRGAR